MEKLLWRYVQRTELISAPNSAVKAFAEATLKFVGKHEGGERPKYAREHFTSNEVEQLLEIEVCDYILQTLFRFTMLAETLDSHEAVMEPLAAAMWQHMSIQYFG